MSNNQNVGNLINKDKKEGTSSIFHLHGVRESKTDQKRKEKRHE